MSPAKFGTKHALFGFRGRGKTGITITLGKGFAGFCPTTDTMNDTMESHANLTPDELIQ